jgi:hypothetical protein
MTHGCIIIVDELFRTHNHMIIDMAHFHPIIITVVVEDIGATYD